MEQVTHTLKDILFLHWLPTIICNRLPDTLQLAFQIHSLQKSSSKTDEAEENGNILNSIVIIHGLVK